MRPKKIIWSCTEIESEKIKFGKKATKKIKILGFKRFIKNPFFKNSEFDFSILIFLLSVVTESEKYAWRDK